MEFYDPTKNGIRQRKTTATGTSGNMLAYVIEKVN